METIIEVSISETGDELMVYKSLRKKRNEKGITAKDMATALNLKTQAAYYKKENGTVKFTLEEAKKVSKLLKEPIEEIFFGK